MSATVSVRYIVDDLTKTTDFYIAQFGFELDVATPAFAALEKGGLKLLLSAKNSAGGKPMSGGAEQSAGGWNRIMLIVPNLSEEIARLKANGIGFRGDAVTGPAGSLIVLDDPSGNPIELFEPAEH